MSRILIPVDGSERALAAVHEVIRQAQAGATHEVHVLNVQPPAFPEETMVGLPATQVDTYYYQQSEKALAGAQRALRDASVPFTVHRAVGPVAETIASLARELACDAIVLTPHGRGRIAGMLLGSVSNRLLHLAQVPVTLVKDREAIDFAGRLGAS
jgi:nucleotide-binding universal stress UspA family protein